MDFDALCRCESRRAQRSASRSVPHIVNSHSVSYCVKCAQNKQTTQWFDSYGHGESTKNANVTDAELVKILRETDY